MPVEEREGVILVGVCPTCNEIRVKSKKAINKPEDCKPENFTGVNGAPDPSGDVPLCHECSAILKFAREESLQPRAPAPATMEKIREKVTGTSAPGPAQETLFEAREGEVISNIYPDGNAAFVVITDRRIVRVRL